jgi:molybdate transport system substrate-binding protein
LTETALKGLFCIKYRLVALFVICAAALPVSAAGEITVAAAADLNLALSEIAATYQKQTGNTVRLSFGSSGNLFNQVQNGAPFDLFLSADVDYPKKLIEAGLAERTSLYRYARGRLVLWLPTSSSLDVERRGMEVLLDPSVKKIAIANPQHAPYGRAAVAALRHFGIYDKIADRLVLGENVSQSAQFVESGNAQAGIVALSHALAPAMKDKGRYWEIPADAYPVLEQAAVIVSRSANKKEAAAFLEYLKSPEATQVLRRHGFSLPEEKH